MAHHISAGQAQAPDRGVEQGSLGVPPRFLEVVF